MGASRLKLAIVGAGTAGLALAAMMAPAHEVTVFEKTARPSPVGAGILLQPSGMRVLDKLGVLPELLALGAPIGKLYGTLANGWPVMDMRYADHAPESLGLGLSRHALTSVLLAAALSRGARVEGGRDIQGIRPGEGLEGFDLTVLANGTFSPLRESAGIRAGVTPYPWGALWILLRDPGQLVGPVLRQWYRGAHQMLGLMPTGFHSREEAGSQSPWISLFWSLRADRLESLRARPLQDWKHEVMALAPESGTLLGQINAWDQMAWARYADVRCPQPYSGRVACIGDAAHAMSPQLGQGCNMALVDAQEMARCLAEEPSAGAFERYARRRQRHLATYQFFSKQLTPMFQSDGVVMPTLRNLVFWPGSRLPGASRLASTLLTGLLLHPRD